MGLEDFSRDHLWGEIEDLKSEIKIIKNDVKNLKHSDNKKTLASSKQSKFLRLGKSSTKTSSDSMEIGFLGAELNAWYRYTMHSDEFGANIQIVEAIITLAKNQKYQDNLMQAVDHLVNIAKGNIDQENDFLTTNYRISSEKVLNGLYLLDFLIYKFLEQKPKAKSTSNSRTLKLGSSSKDKKMSAYEKSCIMSIRKLQDWYVGTAYKKDDQVNQFLSSNFGSYYAKKRNELHCLMKLDYLSDKELFDKARKFLTSTCGYYQTSDRFDLMNGPSYTTYYLSGKDFINGVIKYIEEY